MLSYADASPSPLYHSHRSAISSVGMPSSTRSYKSSPKLRHKHIFIVTGPAGCGKSTIAKYLADIHQFPYIEGDDVRFYSD
jgi:gluconokinase